MNRPPRVAAFTLIEMITVIAIIAILAGLVLAINGLTQGKAARSRADAEIRMLGAALESYKTDNGGYPQDAQLTDMLNPTDPSGLSSMGQANGTYAKSSRYLYQALTGDTNYTGAMTKNYAPDFFKTSRLGGTKENGVVKSIQYIQDPFGNSYGYSTAGLAAEQQYRTALATNPAATRPQQTIGFNPTYDLWSTCGDTLGNTAKWAKNW